MTDSVTHDLHREHHEGLLDTVTYDDRTPRDFLVAMLIWGIVGLLVGVFIALQLTGLGTRWGPSFLNAEWLSFGRLRPLHTNAVIFAFTGNGIFAGVYYSMQRLLKARTWNYGLARFNFWGWQAIIVAAAITLPLGITTSKEYAELEWPIDIAITLVWVAFGLNLFGTIFSRRERHLYVAIWFYLATWVGIAMLHIVNSLAVPVGPFKSYSVYAGVQDALVQWWYGHNAVAFFLTTPLLGLMYYYLPKAAQRPVYSYRLSIIHYWSLIFIYIWAGPHHLLHSSLPEWAQTLGVTFSIMLLAPSWGGMINGLLTLRGAWDRVRESPVLKFFVCAVTFYGMATFEGPLLSIRSVNALSHNTDWTIGHVHSGALGWVGMLLFGMAYWLVPKLYKTKLHSDKLANFHFWIGTIGIVLYAVTMWFTGITQGNFWFQFNEEGVLKYGDWMAMFDESNTWAFYWVRAFGGLMYLTGAVLCLYNIVKTIAAAEPLQDETVQLPPLRREEYVDQRIVAAAKESGGAAKKLNALHALVERWPLLFASLTAVALVIGGLFEIVPNMIQGAVAPKIASVKPYTPLELAGRDIYIREGCVSCHTQMVRTLRAEVMRYDPKNKDHTHPGEGIYDRPFLWGSKRTGPDLAREGVLRRGPSQANWHFQHLWDPYLTSPGSIMPGYRNLFHDQTDFASLPGKLSVLAGPPMYTPYDPQVIERAEEVAMAQALPTAEYLWQQYPDEASRTFADRGTTIPVPGTAEELARREIIALIAYLQRLGTDLRKGG